METSDGNNQRGGELGNYRSADDHEESRLAVPVPRWKRWLFLRRLSVAEAYIRRERIGEYLLIFERDSGRLRRAWYVPGRRMRLPEAAKRELRGGILTHNHPDGWETDAEDNYISGGESFSGGDIELACCWEVAEIRAVSREYLYVMHPPVSGWNRDYWHSVIEPAVAAAERRLAAELGDHLTDEKASGLHHALWTLVAADTGVYYARRRVS